MSRNKMKEFLVVGHIDNSPGTAIKINEIKEYLIAKGPVGKNELVSVLDRLKAKIEVAYEDLDKAGKINKKKFGLEKH